MADKIPMLALSPTMEEGTIIAWRKREGDAMVTGDVICEVETDKASMDYDAGPDGILLKILKPEGSKVRVGETIAISGKAGEDISSLLASIGSPQQAPNPTAETLAQPAPAVTATAHAASTRIFASPLARKIAAERGVALESLQGSGPGGRIVKSDVESFKAQPPAVAEPATRVFAEASGADEVIKVSGKRAVIARRLSESMYSAPHFYLTTTVRVDELLKLRQRANETAQKDAKLGFNPFFIKLVATALQRHPDVNASWRGDTILRFGSQNIGLAVDLGDGLFTPVVRAAGVKGIRQIDEELKSLIAKVSAKTIQPEEYSGAGFTISNLGSFGIEEFTAIINPPGSAILALGEVKKTPVVDDEDRVVVAQTMKMTLSCDHRVIDGSLGAKFLAELKRLVEDPANALL